MTHPAMQSPAIDHRALSDFRALASRIDGNGPRYTSYPTADRFHAGLGEAGYHEALASCCANAPAPLSLYLHIPFCENIC